MSVCVVLNGCDSQEDMNAEAKKLLNLAFDTYEIYTPELPEDMVKETVVCGGEELSVKLAPEGLYPIVIPREHIVWWSAILQQRRSLTHL